MSVSPTSSLPRVNYRGIKEDSAVNLTIPSEALAIRLPFFFTLARWGETDRARYCDTAAAELLYGAEFQDPLSPFFTHQSQFIKSHLSTGSKALILGMRPADAKQASFRLALDVVADDIQQYQLNTDGTYLLDSAGNKQPIVGTTAPGYRVQWRVITIPDAVGGGSGFGKGAKAEGTMVSVKDGSTSFQYPITDGLARFAGGPGNDLGFRLMYPTTLSANAADEGLQDTLGSCVYRLQVVKRANSASTATVKQTLQGATYVDFTFKKGTVDKATSTQYSVDKTILQNYESRDPKAFTGFGPFEKLSVYNDQIAEVLALFAAAETAFTGETFADVNMFNFLTGVDINGIPYKTFVVEGPALGGVSLTELTNNFMSGGSDGTVTQDVYNQLVADWLGDLENSVVPIKSMAKMPYDSVWDSGFPVETKKLFAKFHNMRPDVMVHVCTQDVSKPQNTAAQDSSVGVTLRSYFRSMQESVEFGTKPLRFTVVPNSGYVIGDTYDGLVPFLEYLLILGGKYMGAESGSMNPTYSFGRGEQTVIDRYRDHNVTYRDDTVRNVDWNNGLVLADDYDMSRLFWPGVQTLYEDHTSIMHAYLNACIACNLTRIGTIIWRELAGDSQMTDPVFLDEVNKRVTAKTSNPDRYDGRADITPNAYYNALDEELGTAWHLDIDMAGENMRTTESLAVIAQRRRNSTEGQ